MEASKKCSKCGEVKSLSAFNKNKQAKGGINSRCRECMNYYNKEYRDRNKERLNERKKLWLSKSNNKDMMVKKRKVWKKLWRDKNKVRLAKVDKLWRDKNKVRRNENARIARNENKDEINRLKREYYAKNSLRINEIKRINNHKPENKRTQARYRLNNKEKINARSREKRLIMNSSYIASLLGTITSECPMGLIELKREQLKLWRASK